MSATELRKAAAELREFWPTAPIRPDLATALADWLDWGADCVDEGAPDDLLAHELVVARLINGGA